MKSLRLIIAFALLALGIVFCLWGAGVVGYDQASDSLRRVLLVVGGSGIAIILAFFVMGAGKKSGESDHGKADGSSPTKTLNSGPKF